MNSTNCNFSYNSYHVSRYLENVLRSAVGIANEINAQYGCLPRPTGQDLPCEFGNLTDSFRDKLKLFEDVFVFFSESIQAVDSRTFELDKLDFVGLDVPVLSYQTSAIGSLGERLQRRNYNPPSDSLVGRPTREPCGCMKFTCGTGNCSHGDLGANESSTSLYLALLANGASEQETNDEDIVAEPAGSNNVDTQTAELPSLSSSSPTQSIALEKHDRVGLVSNDDSQSTDLSLILNSKSTSSTTETGRQECQNNKELVGGGDIETQNPKLSACLTSNPVVMVRHEEGNIGKPVSRNGACTNNSELPSRPTSATDPSWATEQETIPVGETGEPIGPCSGETGAQNPEFCPTTNHAENKGHEEGNVREPVGLSSNGACATNSELPGVLPSAPSWKTETESVPVVGTGEPVGCGNTDELNLDLSSIIPTVSNHDAMVSSGPASSCLPPSGLSSCSDSDSPPLSFVLSQMEEVQMDSLQPSPPVSFPSSFILGLRGPGEEIESEILLLPQELWPITDAYLHCHGSFVCCPADCESRGLWFRSKETGKWKRLSDSPFNRMCTTYRGGKAFTVSGVLEDTWVKKFDLETGTPLETGSSGYFQVLEAERLTDIDLSPAGLLAIADPEVKRVTIHQQSGEHVLSLCEQFDCWDPFYLTWLDSEKLVVGVWVCDDTNRIYCVRVPSGVFVWKTHDFPGVPWSRISSKENRVYARIPGRQGRPPAFKVLIGESGEEHSGLEVRTESGVISLRVVDVEGIPTVVSCKRGEN